MRTAWNLLLAALTLLAVGYLVWELLWMKMQ